MTRNARRGRRRSGAGEFDEDGRRVRGRRRRRWRRCKASGGLWIGGEAEGGPAELPGASVSRGVAGSHGGSRRWRRLRSVAGGETEERGGGRSRERGRSERGSGRCRGTRGGVQKRRKQEVASRAATTRPASLWRPSGARWETVAALVGWASSWAMVGRQLSPGEGPSGLLSLSYLIVSAFFLFYFSVLN